MKVDKLHIRSRFKNLENVTVDFDEEHLMTVVVGRNGSGKSNVLEALVAIFRNLDLGEEPPFSYELNFQLGEESWVKWYDIKVDADPSRGKLSKQYQVLVKNKHHINGEFEPVSISAVKRDKKTKLAEYLPNFMFAYYSGPSDRLEKYFRKHRDTYYRELIGDELDLRADIRSLFYAKPIHSKHVLLAFFQSPELKKEQEFLRENLGINSVDSIHFVLKKPSWGKNKNDTFWGAKGIARSFIERLMPYALAPVRVTRVDDDLTSLTGKKHKNEFVHIFLPTEESLHEVAKDLTPSIFFKLLESSELSQIIAEVNIRVNVTFAPEPITFKELSEGEQQLLTVLGLLKFTGGKDSLFLLDEPDTHLNPSWAVKYLKFLREFVPNHETSHLLMVTHHPLAIAELKKEQVQVMKRGEEQQITAKMPDESPRGMGINLILRSDIFGLQTTLDDDTNQKLTARNALAAKEILSKDKIFREEGLAPEDEEQYLSRLNTELEGLGFNLATDDPDYLEFLRSKYHLKNSEDN
ncbi:MAG: AAA family ATPase [Pseudoalteromonas sp.]